MKTTFRLLTPSHLSPDNQSSSLYHRWESAFNDLLHMRPVAYWWSDELHGCLCDMGAGFTPGGDNVAAFSVNMHEEEL
ncbi:MAG TPA: hypothetical protein VHV83_18960, partial [Armatimonadota bacterium]|nr:hypothetical protein [Armatimonadota bacterium]